VNKFSHGKGACHHYRKYYTIRTKSYNILTWLLDSPQRKKQPTTVLSVLAGSREVKIINWVLDIAKNRCVKMREIIEKEWTRTAAHISDKR